jgi:hypothetical protein
MFLPFPREFHKYALCLKGQNASALGQFFGNLTRVAGLLPFKATIMRDRQRVPARACAYVVAIVARVALQVRAITLRCQFRIVRPQSFVSDMFVWNASSVIGTSSGSGINCTFTRSINRANRGFDVTLNLNN